MLWLGIAAGAVLLALAILTQGEALGEDHEPLVIEAEDAHLTGGMQVKQAPDASGGEYVQLSGRAQSTVAGQVAISDATFCVVIPEDGHFTFTARIQTGNSSTSYLLRLDFHEPWIWQVQPSKSFQDIEIRFPDQTSEMFLEEGEHVISFAPRKSSSRLDRLMVTPEQGSKSPKVCNSQNQASAPTSATTTAVGGSDQSTTTSTTGSLHSTIITSTDPAPTTTAPTPTTPVTESTTTTSAGAPAATTTTTAGLSVSGQVVVNGESGVVIQGLKISNLDGPCVLILASSEVVFRDSEIGPCGGKAIEIRGSSTVTLERLTVHDSGSGVYALTSEHVAVVGNTFTNAGRNFVQFDKVTGTGNVISGNSGANILGGSIAEDFISIYKSSGTSESPITVTNNSFRNGGPSVSGSGIMVGDNGGSHILVQANTLTNPGQVGIGVAGGTSIRVLDNIVYSATQPWSNVGIYVWNQSGGPCGSIEVSSNQVEWYNADGAENPRWDGGNCGTIAEWDNNNWHADLGID